MISVQLRKNSFSIHLILQKCLAMIIRMISQNQQTVPIFFIRLGNELKIDSK